MTSRCLLHATVFSTAVPGRAEAVEEDHEENERPEERAQGAHDGEDLFDFGFNGMLSTSRGDGTQGADVAQEPDDPYAPQGARHSDEAHHPKVARVLRARV